MFSLFQLLVVAVLIAGVILFFGKIKKKEKSLVAGLLVCIVLASVVANGILHLVPLPTDEIIIAATGEKNESAKSNEVNIINYLVGGEEYVIKNPTDGKWFWKGDVYMWRNENDSRQPAGTTRSITLNIPYGKDRAVQFGLSEWNGIVEVSYNGESNRYDLFKSGDETTFLAAVPDTDSFALYSTKLLSLLLFTAIIVLLIAYPVFCIVKYEYEDIKKFWQKHWDKLVYGCIAFGCFFVMFESGKAGSLWLDEVWTLGWVYGENPNKVYIFFQALYDLWFYLMPYGQEYLLIISELLVVATIYILGLIGNLYKSKRFGIFMSTIGATSLTIMAQCGTEFRPYAILLFAITLALYLFIIKQINLSNISPAMLVLYSIVLVLCMDSHQFGLLTAGFFMLFDLFLIVRRKISLNALVEFVLPLIYGLYWLFTQFLNDLSNANNYTIATPPNAKDVINTIIWLCGVNSGNLMLFLLILGSCIGLVGLVNSIKGKKFNFKNDYILLTIFSIPCLIFSFNLFYSVVLNPNNPLWVTRYFLPAIPFFIFLIALAMDTILSLLISRKDNENSKYSFVFTVAIVMCFCIIGWCKMPYEINIVNDYKGAAEYIMSENEIYSSNTLCYITGNPDVNKGFEYYLTHKGERDSINHIGNLLEYTSADLESYNTIYVVSYKNRFNGATLLRNNGFEEVFNNNDTRLNVRKWERVS